MKHNFWDCLYGFGKLIKPLIDMLSSVRSDMALALVFTLCWITVKNKVDYKDFLLVVSTAINFYFMLKKRLENGTKP